MQTIAMNTGEVFVIPEEAALGGGSTARERGKVPSKAPVSGAGGF